MQIESPTDRTSLGLAGLIDDMRGWLERERSGYFFRFSATLTFTLGVYLHVTHLLVGRDMFLERVLTPTFDLILAVPMTYAAVSGWMAWRRAILPARTQRLLYTLLCAYLSVSVPVHVQSLITGRVELIIRAFPEGYSVFILPVMAAMIVFVQRIRFQSQPRRHVS